MLDGLKKYKIDLFHLSVGEHEYGFDFGPDFFENFENSIIEKGSGIVKVKLKKSETFLELSIGITGKIELICDRSLEPFDYEVDIIKNLILKFSEEMEIVDEDEIEFIPWNTPSINVGQYIYEFLSLEIPIKKLHPKFSDLKEKEYEMDEKLVYSSSDLSQDTTEVDPRWQKLKKLKGK